MQIPIRLELLLRPAVAPGILLAVGVGTLVFTTTPFLLPEVSRHYDLSLSLVSLISVFQLGGFVVSTYTAGRFLKPTRRVFVLALLLSSAANLVSAMLPLFALLVALRLASGIALGVIAWFGWTQAFGDERRMGDVAVTGPIVGVVAAPLIAQLADRGGAGLVFAALAVFSLAPLLLRHGSTGQSAATRGAARHRPVPAAMVILVCLALFTLGGSAVFQYAVVLGTGSPGLTQATIAVAFSLNALVSIPAARWRHRRHRPGPWMALTGACAVVVAITGLAGVFLGAVVVWGFAFWMAIPSAFRVLADRSRFPEERAGDAQAMMAAGRTVGPFVGGVLIDGPGRVALGLVGGGLMILAGACVLAVRTTAPRVTSG